LTHLTNADLCENGSLALGHLCSFNPQLQDVASTNGTCDVIVDSMKSFPVNSGLTVNCMWAVVDVCRNNSYNTTYVGKIGGCLAAVNAITIHRSSADINR
jgi:hypothetical protein